MRDIIHKKNAILLLEEKNLQREKELKDGNVFNFIFILLNYFIV
jgi:hypothetical protein